MNGSPEVNAQISLFKKLDNFQPTGAQGVNTWDPGPEIPGVTYLREGWKKEGFEAEKELKEIPGELIEVGGPTTEFELLDPHELAEALGRKFLVSNIHRGVPQYADKAESEITGYYGSVDFQADARNLPFPDASIAAFFASNLDGDIRRETLGEAMRVLRGGGLLIWQGAQSEDLKAAEKLGFEILEYDRTDYFNRSVILNLILGKPQPK